jgi:hypothetical protein
MKRFLRINDLNSSKKIRIENESNKKITKLKGIISKKINYSNYITYFLSKILSNKRLKDYVEYKMCRK